MDVDVAVADLDLSDLSLFVGWAMNDELLRRLGADGFGDLRLHDGVVFQHVLAGRLSITALAGRMGVTQQAASKAVIIRPSRRTRRSRSSCTLTRSSAGR